MYVPRDHETLVAFMDVNSDATSEGYGKISVRELPDSRTDGPIQIAATFEHRRDGAPGAAELHQR